MPTRLPVEIRLAEGPEALLGLRVPHSQPRIFTVLQYSSHVAPKTKDVPGRSRHSFKRLHELWSDDEPPSPEQERDLMRRYGIDPRYSPSLHLLDPPTTSQ
jgi:hypothetical protein